MVKHLKYDFIGDITQPLHELTKKYLKHLASRGDSVVLGNPLLVPVPLHLRRENWRGYNQSALLADLISKNYHLETSNVLVRTTHTKPQADIKDRIKRLENVKGLYACPNKEFVQGRNILLIDDVCTTGATLNECALVLKEAGARSVSAIVIARG